MNYTVPPKKDDNTELRVKQDISPVQAEWLTATRQKALKKVKELSEII